MTPNNAHIAGVSRLFVVRLTEFSIIFKSGLDWACVPLEGSVRLHDIVERILSA
jgi:hypothetical protein